MDHIKLSTAAVFLKENTSAVFIHMSFIGEYLSLSLLLLTYVNCLSVFPTGCQFTSAASGGKGGLLMTFH